MMEQNKPKTWKDILQESKLAVDQLSMQLEIQKAVKKLAESNLNTKL